MNDGMYREDMNANHDEIKDDFYDFTEKCGISIDADYDAELDCYDEVNDNVRMLAMAKAVGASISGSICTLANAIMTASCIRNNGSGEITNAVMEVAGSLAKELPEAIREVACGLDFDAISNALDNLDINVATETQDERCERHLDEWRRDMERYKMQQADEPTTTED